jgi:hypothetical protein
MTQQEIDSLVSKAVNAREIEKALSRSDIYELGKILSSGISSDLRSFLSKSYDNHNALLLKAALSGEKSLSSNEKFTFNEITVKRGRYLPGKW